MVTLMQVHYSVQLFTGLEQAKAELLSEQWKKSYVAMSSSMIGKTLTVNQLVDMEWKFGGSSTSLLFSVSSLLRLFFCLLVCLFRLVP